jgi:transcriptional regulator with XRE-family HTH domain
VQIPNLREMRELQGLTQKELADVSGVSLRSVAGYEGGASVRPNTARKLAKALDVKVADLVGGDVRPKARALSLRDNEPETALPEDEVLFEAYYSPESFDEVWDEAMREAKAKHHQVPEGMQIAALNNGYKVEVRIESVPPASRTRRRRRATTKTRNNRETG